MTVFNWTQDEHGAWHGGHHSWSALAVYEGNGRWKAQLTLHGVTTTLSADNSTDVKAKADAWVESQRDFARMRIEMPILRKHYDVTLRRLRELEERVREYLHADARAWTEYEYIAHVLDDPEDDPTARLGRLNEARKRMLDALTAVLSRPDLCPICNSVIDLQRALCIPGSSDIYCGRECAGRALFRRKQGHEPKDG